MNNQKILHNCARFPLSPAGEFRYSLFQMLVADSLDGQVIKIICSRRQIVNKNWKLTQPETKSRLELARREIILTNASCGPDNSSQ